ncbi:class II aldolase/adducin family protein [Alteribacillus iranensis]|uniref:L-fuculose-phosphate aldolase n=1 Tax=Alteribacillus iranensis TaxID=930128 RepID=A0A1I2BDI7_9BACI|nr:class II aldolase/adducin family protein [Alteribacillus iranensis]SFE53958.1 L-fuculose-phosphate aldolase [Alteribacillus iranensis]
MQELLKKELSYVSQKVFARGMIQATGGNLSVRIPGENTILIKRSGVSLGEMTREDCVVMSMGGKKMEGLGDPSKEYRFHLGIYQERPDIHAIVHCHPNFAIGYGSLGMELPLPTVTAKKILEYVPVAESAPSGSEQLAKSVTQLFREHPSIKACLMEEHGICATGKSLENAFDIATLVEDTAKQAFIISSLKANHSIIEGGLRSRGSITGVN